MTLFDSTSNVIKVIHLKLLGLNSLEDAEKIELALDRVDGVHNVSLNPKNNMVTIEFDTSKIVVESLIETLEEIDYGAILNSKFDENEYNCIFRYIGSSMDCFRGFINGLQRKNGIIDIKVDIEMKRIQIRFNPEKIEIDEIKNLFFELSFLPLT
ncbi:MAG: heavy-metal-associated domain-containing protein [Candidatus Hodarchaeales archaeon]|jgi:copper chaperone CopZ